MRRLAPHEVEHLHLRSRRPHEVGGEWDVVRGWPPRVLRRLRGAGYLGVRYGLAPDQLAHDLEQLVGPCDVDEALEAWRAAVEQLLLERRRYSRRRRETRLAQRHGVDWYTYRALKYSDRYDEPVTVHEHARRQGWR